MVKPCQTTSLGTCTSKPSMSHSLRQAVATVKPKAVASRAPMERQNKVLRWCEGARFTKKWKITGNALQFLGKWGAEPYDLVLNIHFYWKGHKNNTSRWRITGRTGTINNSRCQKSDFRLCNWDLHSLVGLQTQIQTTKNAWTLEENGSMSNNNTFVDRIGPYDRG